MRHSISKELFPGFAADLYSRGQLYKIHSAEEGVITVDVQEVDCLLTATDAANIPVDITQALRELQAAIVDAAQCGKRFITFSLNGLGEPAKNKLVDELEAKGYKHTRNQHDSTCMDIRW